MVDNIKQILWPGRIKNQGLYLRGERTIPHENKIIK